MDTHSVHQTSPFSDPTATVAVEVKSESTPHSLSTVILESGEFTKKVMQTLAEMQEENKHCDIALMGRDNRSIFGHSCVLAAASPSFNSMISEDMERHGMLFIHIPEIRSEILETIVKFIYKGSFVTTFADIDELIAAADFLGFDELKHICEEVQSKHGEALLTSRKAEVNREQMLVDIINEKLEEIAQLRSAVSEKIESDSVNNSWQANSSWQGSQEELTTLKAGQLPQYVLEEAEANHSFVEQPTSLPQSFQFQQNDHVAQPQGGSAGGCQQQQISTESVLGQGRDAQGHQMASTTFQDISHSDVKYIPVLPQTKKANLRALLSGAEIHPHLEEEEEVGTSGVVEVITEDSMEVQASEEVGGEEDMATVLTDVYQCPICSEIEFRSWGELREHMDDVHDDCGQFMCPICHRMYKSSVDMQSHMQLHAEEKSKAQSFKKCLTSNSRTAPAFNKKIKKEQAVFRCEPCSMFFSQKASLYKHIQLTHQQRHKCTKCNRTFNSEGFLERHMKIHAPGFHPKLFVCDTPGCDYQAEKKRDVFRHKLKAHVQKSQPELTKEEASSTVSGDIDNLKGGEGISYACHVCKKKFPYPSRLRRHFAMSHENKKRYQCIFCSYTHYHLNQIKEHFKNKHHAAFVPPDETFMFESDTRSALRCCICGLEVSSPKQLYHHTQTDHAFVFTTTKDQSFPCLCQECGQSFQRPTQLRKHIAVHHQKLKRFACTVCSYRSYFLAYMKEHFLSRHGILEIPKDDEFRISMTDS